MMIMNQLRPAAAPEPTTSKDASTQQQHQQPFNVLSIQATIDAVVQVEKALNNRVLSNAAFSKQDEVAAPIVKRLRKLHSLILSDGEHNDIAVTLMRTNFFATISASAGIILKFCSITDATLRCILPLARLPLPMRRNILRSLVANGGLIFSLLALKQYMQVSASVRVQALELLADILDYVSKSDDPAEQQHYQQHQKIAGSSGLPSHTNTRPSKNLPHEVQQQSLVQDTVHQMLLHGAASILSRCLTTSVSNLHEISVRRSIHSLIFLILETPTDLAVKVASFESWSVLRALLTAMRDMTLSARVDAVTLLTGLLAASTKVAEQVQQLGVWDELSSVLAQNASIIKVPKHWLKESLEKIRLVGDVRGSKQGSATRPSPDERIVSFYFNQVASQTQTQTQAQAKLATSPSPFARNASEPVFSLPECFSTPLLATADSSMGGMFPGAGAGNLTTSSSMGGLGMHTTGLQWPGPGFSLDSDSQVTGAASFEGIVTALLDTHAAVEASASGKPYSYGVATAKQMERQLQRHIAKAKQSFSGFDVIQDTYTPKKAERPRSASASAQGGGKDKGQEKNYIKHIKQSPLGHPLDPLQLRQLMRENHGAVPDYVPQALGGPPVGRRPGGPPREAHVAKPKAGPGPDEYKGESEEKTDVHPGVAGTGTEPAPVKAKRKAPRSAKKAPAPAALPSANTAVVEQPTSPAVPGHRFVAQRLFSDGTASAGVTGGPGGNSRPSTASAIDRLSFAEKLQCMIMQVKEL